MLAIFLENQFTTKGKDVHMEGVSKYNSSYVKFEEKGTEVLPICPVCLQKEESVDHALVGCNDLD